MIFDHTLIPINNSLFYLGYHSRSHRQSFTAYLVRRRSDTQLHTFPFLLSLGIPIGISLCLTTLLLYACQNSYLFYELGLCFWIFMLEIWGGEWRNEMMRNMFPYWFDCRYDGINHVLALADRSPSPHKYYIQFNFVSFLYFY